MLDTLTIDQFAIIEHCDIHFKAGFNVLSGETGAGKSILIDAISLLIGERADAGMIRYGANKADIHANFSHIPATLIDQLDAHEILDEDIPENALIRRTIREKGSKPFFNAYPITVGLLKELSPQLINIHGQHANQALLQNNEQRRRVDRYGKLEPLVAEVSEKYRTWQTLEQQWQTWQNEREALNKRIDLLTYQLQEFEAIAPKTGEFETLSQQHQLLASAEDILSTGIQLSDILYNNENSIATRLRQASQLSEKLLGYHPNFQENAELLNQAVIYIDEAHDALNKQLNQIELDPTQLAQLDERMSTLHSLAHKHHLEPDDLAEQWQSLQEEYQALQHIKNDGENREIDVKDAETFYLQSAEKLSHARKKAGKALAKNTLQWIHQLGMEKADFRVNITPSDKLTHHGVDNITFLLCANPGQTLQPLAKVVSGGELSRISLAIEVACLDDQSVPHTLIFDEIDAGIGGEIADTVGQLLAKLSQTRQVLCITHLPQVAVYAQHHYRIEKTSNGNSTQTAVTPLDKNERISEIARMLGNTNSNTSRQHAQTMLTNAGN